MTGDRAPRRRIALISGWPISPDDQHNGFTPRYVDLLEQLGQDHDLLVVYLETDRAQFEPHLARAAAVAEVVEIPVPRVGATRRDRITRSARQLLGLAPNQAWEMQLHGQLQRWEPEVVVAISQLQPTSLRAATRLLPTVSFIEEDASATPEGRAGPKAKLLLALEAAGRSRCGAPPAVAVVISPHEQSWARRQYPRSQIVVVPHRIDLAYWEQSVAPADDVCPDDVLVVGDMSARRNAEGLRAVADALAERADASDHIHLVVISFAEPHPLLQGLPEGMIRFVGRVDDPRPYYRAVGQVLVPSFIVPGAKTTILQAWATGRPVVTTGPAARSIGATPGRDVLSAESAAGVAEAVVLLAGDPGRRDELRRAGCERLHHAHGQDAAADAVGRAIELAIARGPLPASLTGDLRGRVTQARAS
jgi:glycosyltransferase involved in cell wall biosynthesis